MSDTDATTQPDDPTPTSEPAAAEPGAEAADDRAADAPPPPAVPFDQFLHGLGTTAAGFLLNAAIDLVRGNPEELVGLIHNLSKGFRAFAEEPEFEGALKKNRAIVEGERKAHREMHWDALERAFKNVIEAKKASVSDEVVLHVLEQFDPLCDGPSSPVTSFLDGLLPIITQAFSAAASSGGCGGGPRPYVMPPPAADGQEAPPFEIPHIHPDTAAAVGGTTLADLLKNFVQQPGLTVTEFPMPPSGSRGVVGVGVNAVPEVIQHMSSADVARAYGVPMSPMNPNVPAAGRWIFIGP